MNLHNLTKEFNYNWKLAYPVILGMLGHTLVQFFDNIMVGQMGTAELAAVSLGNSFFFVPMSIAIGFSSAITPLVAEADGSGQIDQGKQAFKHGLLICTFLGVLLCLLLFGVSPFMSHMGQSEEVVILAKPYLWWIALSVIPMTMFQAFKQFADGMSNTKYPMYAAIVSNVANIILNYLLIFGKFGFPELGVIGAAIGTLVSRVIGLIYLWYLIYQKPRLKPFIIHWNFRDIRTPVIKKIISLGVPSSLQMFFEVMIFTAAIWMSGALGKNPQAANQIALNLASMTFMVATGLSVAATIRVGNQWGLKDYKNLRRIAFSIFLMTFLIEAAFAVFFLLGNAYLPQMYLNVNDMENVVDNMDVIRIASKLLIVCALFQISDGVQVAVLGALRGMQDVVIPTWLTMIAYWGIGFPVIWYLGFHTYLESTGIWLGLLAGLTASAILLYSRFHILSNRMINQANND